MRDEFIRSWGRVETLAREYGLDPTYPAFTEIYKKYDFDGLRKMHIRELRRILKEAAES